VNLSELKHKIEQLQKKHDDRDLFVIDDNEDSNVKLIDIEIREYKGKLFLEIDMEYDV
jgi:hypothetical protein